MNNNTYGVITGSDNIYVDTSNTLKGAKRYATINGYKKVGIRYNNGYVVKVLAIKFNNKWVNELPENLIVDYDIVNLEGRPQ